MIGYVFEVIHKLGSGFWGIRVGTKAMVQLKMVTTPAE